MNLGMYQCILVPIPRCASGAMATVLKQDRTNYTSKELKDMLGARQWETTFTFAFVRHPIDRFLSSFAATAPMFEEYEEVHIQDIPRHNFILFRPQVDYLTEEVNFIGRYENIDKDWEKLAKKIGFPTPLPKINVTTNPKDKILTKDEEGWVREYYKEDFTRFGYR